MTRTGFPAHATITFPKQGQIAGTAPCHSYSATQTAPYPWVEAGPILATKRACPDLDAETNFFAALSQASISEVSGDTFLLSDNNGHEMVFTAASH